MPKYTSRFIKLMFCLFMTVSLSSCTFIFQKGRRVDTEKITKLKRDLTDLERQKTDLERAKEELEKRMGSEISDKEVKVEMLERGLVITFVAEVLFDSGKDVLRPEAFIKLDKVANVLNTTVKDLGVGIEGHTDSDPIRHSGWKSNWELSVARALSVLHYMIDKQAVDPHRLSATGFGEFRPVAPNTAKEDKQKNRRVEIVILPKVEKEGR